MDTPELQQWRDQVQQAQFEDETASMARLARLGIHSGNEGFAQAIFTGVQVGNV